MSAKKTTSEQPDTVNINMTTINSNTITVSIYRRKKKKKLKKKYGHKTHVCIFCKKEFSRLAEHFMRRHRHEDKIRDIIATTDKQAKMWKWKTLRQQGDHFFNLMENSGERKVVKVSTQTSNKDKYFTCSTCFARLKNCSRFEHRLVCKKVFHVNEDIKEISDIYVRMPESLINKIRQSKYLNSFLKQLFESGETVRTFRKTCKDLIYLEEEMQRITGEKKPISCFLTSKYVDDVITIIKNLGGQMTYGPTKVIMRFPFRVQRFYRLVTRFCKYLAAYYSKQNFDKDLTDVTKFLYAFQIDSQRLLLKQARRSVKIKQTLKPKILPRTSDIARLVRELQEETPQLMRELEVCRNGRAWRRLAENVVCRLTIFNRRRGGGVEKMKISDYTRTQARLSMVTEETIYNLTPEDREFLSNIRVVEILHKSDNLILIYITKELQKAMDMLLEYRKYARDIHPKNDYFFAAGKQSLSSICGCKVLGRYRQTLPDGIKKSFTATSLRKHGATVVQILDLSLQDKEEWAAHMGHSVQVHDKYYKMSEEISAILKTGRILSALNEGKIKYYKGKKINEIPLWSTERDGKAKYTKTCNIIEELINGAEDLSTEGFGRCYQTLPATTQPVNLNSTSFPNGDPVTVILVCSTPFPDGSGRTYVNLIPVTIKPSADKERQSCPYEISVPTTPFSRDYSTSGTSLTDNSVMNNANVIPVTSKPSLDVGPRPTQQAEIQNITCQNRNSESGTNESRISFVIKSITPFQNETGIPYVNLIPVTVTLSPNNQTQTALPTNTATNTNLIPLGKVVQVPTTSTPDKGTTANTLPMQARSCRNESTVQTPIFSDYISSDSSDESDNETTTLSCETAAPTTSKYKRSCRVSTSVTNTPSGSKNQPTPSGSKNQSTPSGSKNQSTPSGSKKPTLRTYSNPRSLRSASTNPPPKKTGKCGTDLLTVTTIPPPQDKGANVIPVPSTSSTDRVVTPEPDQMQQESCNDEIPVQSAPYSDYLSPYSSDETGNETATLSYGTTVSATDKYARSCAVETSVTNAHSLNKNSTLPTYRNPRRVRPARTRSIPKKSGKSGASSSSGTTTSPPKNTGTKVTPVPTTSSSDKVATPDKDQTQEESCNNRNPAQRPSLSDSDNSEDNTPLSYLIPTLRAAKNKTSSEPSASTSATKSPSRRKTSTTVADQTPRISRMVQTTSIPEISEKSSEDVLPATSVPPPQNNELTSSPPEVTNPNEVRTSVIVAPPRGTNVLVPFTHTRSQNRKPRSRQKDIILITLSDDEEPGYKTDATSYESGFFIDEDTIRSSEDEPPLPATTSFSNEAPLPATIPLPNQASLPATTLSNEPPLPATVPITNQAPLPATLPFTNETPLPATTFSNKTPLPATIPSPDESHLPTMRPSTSEIPTTTSPIPAEDVRSNENEIPITTTSSTFTGGTSNETETLAIPSTSSDGTRVQPRTIHTANPSPDNDVLSNIMHFNLVPCF